MKRFLNEEDKKFIRFLNANDVKINSEDRFLLNERNYQIVSLLLNDMNCDIFGLRQDGMTTSILVTSIYKSVVNSSSTLILSINKRVENDIALELSRLIHYNNLSDNVEVVRHLNYGVGVKPKNKMFEDIETFDSMVFDCFNFIHPERLENIFNKSNIHIHSVIKKCYSVDLWRNLPDFENIELTEI